MTTRRAVIYCRISQDREGAGLGVDRQREDCEALAQRLGWTVVATYSDNDLSAYSGKPRPGYRQMVADLDAGHADAVIAWHPDRLHRSPVELEAFIELLERRNATVQTVQAGELDLSTPSGRMVARMLGASARYEVEHKSARIARAHEQAAHAGRWRGGSRPFGWRLRDDGTAVLDEAEAEVVRAAARDILTGMSLGSIVTQLNARGVTTSTGKPWNFTSLRQVLRRPRNAGLSELRGEIVGQLVGWPQILDEDVWRAVCGVLSDPGRRRSRSNRVRWLMAGLARCGGTGPDGQECGQPLRTAVVDSGPQGERQRRTVYRCSAGGEGHVARAAVPLDALVAVLVVARLLQPDAAELLTKGAVGPDVDDLREEAAALRHRLDEAADGFADGDLTKAELSRISVRVRARLDEVEGALARANRRTALADFSGGRDPEDVWVGMSIERRRAVVQDLMTVTVLPDRGGNAFDPERVRVDWLDEE